MRKINTTFNEHYINNVERSCGFKHDKVESDVGSSNKNGVFSYILHKHRNNLSIVKIHENKNLQASSISIPSFGWVSN